MSHQPNNVFAGTQVVSLVEVLPELPEDSTRAALDSLLIRIRTQGLRRPGGR